MLLSKDSEIQKVCFQEDIAVDDRNWSVPAIPEISHISIQIHLLFRKIILKLESKRAFTFNFETFKYYFLTFFTNNCGKNLSNIRPFEEKRKGKIRQEESIS